MEKLRIGVLFGGTSREREVSFAGGRTVYDNLNKSVFEAIPIFVDSFGNLVLLNWEFVYKGSIRDFYPPAEFLPPSPHSFQIYAESLGEPDRVEQYHFINRIGSRIDPYALSGIIDVAFLCLHGSDGEDGRIQGLLELLRIPYTGSGIFSSSVGMNKALQKELMQGSGFDVPEFLVIEREQWFQLNQREYFDKVHETIGFPCVVKAANQGSSIGVTILNDDSFHAFRDAIHNAFFIREIQKANWDSLSFEARVELVRDVCDIRNGIGLPLSVGSRIFHHPEELLSVLLMLFSDGEDNITLEATDAENTVVVEKFIQGREFSCIVIEDETGKPVALPPTEIRKGQALFDYRSKYLPGLSRKITPIDLPAAQIEAICAECERLFKALHVNVYARIDGFIDEAGRIFLNDPNTTSGMMPSSFFFHQAAEIGFNPSQFITYIVHTSLKCRIRDMRQNRKMQDLLNRLEKLMDSADNQLSQKLRVAVVLGGYSSERHISVESGRNIYEKLSSSSKYDPVPLFLSGSSGDFKLYRIPINVLLKDNADDIIEKINSFKRHPVVERIIKRCSGLTSRFASSSNLDAPAPVSFERLAEISEIVFIALHGRPGEDGSLQLELDKVGLPYNGSGPESSRLTIDKYLTNELLSSNGFSVAAHFLARKTDWEKNSGNFYDSIRRRFNFPFIAKPVDDGCSSAVKIVRDEKELKAYVQLVFRSDPALDPDLAATLRIKPSEEFPAKSTILFEELIVAEGAERFLEITGGLVTFINEKGEITYEVFEASEALSGGDVLSLEEKFLAGEGQNITPARYSRDPAENRKISSFVKNELGRAAKLLAIEGYARIDAFVRVYSPDNVQVIFIEVNSLPGMTPATCIFHQAALAHYKPYDFIDRILEFSFEKRKLLTA